MLDYGNKNYIKKKGEKAGNQHDFGKHCGKRRKGL